MGHGPRHPCPTPLFSPMAHNSMPLHRNPAWPAEGLLLSRSEDPKILGIPRSSQGCPADLSHPMGYFPSPGWQPVLIIYRCITDIPQMPTNLHFGQGSVGWHNRAAWNLPGCLLNSQGWQVGSSPHGLLQEAVGALWQLGSKNECSRRQEGGAASL